MLSRARPCGRRLQHLVRPALLHQLLAALPQLEGAAALLRPYDQPRRRTGPRLAPGPLGADGDQVTCLAWAEHDLVGPRFDDHDQIGRGAIADRQRDRSPRALDAPNAEIRSRIDARSQQPYPSVGDNTQLARSNCATGMRTRSAPGAATPCRPRVAQPSRAR